MSKSEFTLTDEQRAKLALALTHRSTTSTDHLSESALAALIEHKGQDDELNVWKQHLSECTECYRVFLECAQWRLEFAQEQAALERQKAAKQKGRLALLLGRWRFLVSSVASVFVVVVLFYLMPVNIPTPTAIQEQDSTVTLDRSEQNIPVDASSEIKSRRKLAPQKLIDDRVPSSAAPTTSADLAGGAFGTEEEPSASNKVASAQTGLVLERRAPDPMATPNLQELLAKNERAEAASAAAAAEQKAKKQSEQHVLEAQAQAQKIQATPSPAIAAPSRAAPAQESFNNQADPERIEVTGSRVKADPMRAEFFALVDMEAFELGVQQMLARQNASETSAVATPLPSAPDSTVETSADRKRSTNSRALGEWHHAAKVYCAQDSSSRQTSGRGSQLASLVRAWPDRYKSLRLDTTQHSLWPRKIGNAQMLCKVSQEISALVE